MPTALLSAEAIAHVCHEANRALQKEQADPTIPVSPKWSKLDEETRQSAIEGVENILSGKVISPQESHREWCKFKTDHGWKLGPVKDEAKKEHPLLISYDELPDSQKDKDALFFAIVRALAMGSVPAARPLERAFQQGLDDGRG